MGIKEIVKVRSTRIELEKQILDILNTYPRTKENRHIEVSKDTYLDFEIDMKYIKTDKFTIISIDQDNFNIVLNGGKYCKNDELYNTNKRDDKNNSQTRVREINKQIHLLKDVLEQINEINICNFRIKEEKDRRLREDKMLNEHLKYVKMMDSLLDALSNDNQNSSNMKEDTKQITTCQSMKGFIELLATAEKNGYVNNIDDINNLYNVTNKKANLDKINPYDLQRSKC